MSGWTLRECTTHYSEAFFVTGYSETVLAIGSYQYIFRAWLALPALRQAACVFEPPHE